MKSILQWRQLELDSPALACPAPLIARAAPGASEWPIALASSPPTALHSGSPALSLTGPSAFSVVPSATSTASTSIPPVLPPALYPGLMCLPALLRLSAENPFQTTMAASIKPIPNDEKVDNRFSVKDPVDWTEDDVIHWLILRVAKEHEIPFEKMSMHNFRCTGKELIEMSEQTFLAKDPQFGSIIFRDFRNLVNADSPLDKFLKDLREDETQFCSPSTSLELPKPQPQMPSGFGMNDTRRTTASLFQNIHQNLPLLSDFASSHLQPQPTGSSLASSVSAALTGLSPMNIMMHNGLSPSSPMLSTQIQPKISPMPGDMSRYNPPSVDTDYDGDDRVSDNKIRKHSDGKIRKRSQHTKGNKLWEFIRDALKDPETCPSVVKWEDRGEGVFRIVESEKLARLWGARKNNTKMTYEKLSRAMRYYYNTKILLPVSGRRLVYKFGPSARGWSSEEPEAYGSYDSDGSEDVDEDMLFQSSLPAFSL